MPPRICVVLPLYDEETEQHFYHLYDLLRRVSDRIDLSVIIEEAHGEVNLGRETRVHAQRFSWAPLRALEILLLVAYEVIVRGHTRVYTHYSTFGAAAAILCRPLGAQAFYWNCEENDGHWLPWRWDWRTLKTKLKIEWPTGLVIRLSTYLVTGTPRMARYYERTYGIGPRRTRVLPNSYDESRFHPGDPRSGLHDELGLRSDAPVALFVHRLSPRKGSRDLPDVMEGVGEGVQWLVCGDGPDRDWLEGELSRRGVTERVRLLGNVPNREIAGLYRLADVLVMPSRQEGFPRVLLEAQACGLPFVATDVGGVRDVVSPLAEERCIAPRDDFAGVAARVRQVLEDDELRSSLCAEGLRHVRRYERAHWVNGFLTVMGSAHGVAAHGGLQG